MPRWARKGWVAEGGLRGAKYSQHVPSRKETPRGLVILLTPCWVPGIPPLQRRGLGAEKTRDSGFQLCSEFSGAPRVSPDIVQRAAWPSRIGTRSHEQLPLPHACLSFLGSQNPSYLLPLPEKVRRRDGVTAEFRRISVRNQPRCLHLITRRTALFPGGSDWGAHGVLYLTVLYLTVLSVSSPARFCCFFALLYCPFPSHRV